MLHSGIDNQLSCNVLVPLESSQAAGVMAFRAGNMYEMNTKGAVIAMLIYLATPRCQRSGTNEV